jgi:hypothetical protein
MLCYVRNDGYAHIDCIGSVQKIKMNLDNFLEANITFNSNKEIPGD